MRSPSAPLPRRKKTEVGWESVVTKKHAGKQQPNENLRQMAQNLQQTHILLTATAEQARKALREACADIFIVEDRLKQEEAYHSEVVQTITNIVGVEVMQEIQERADGAHDSHPEVFPRGRKRPRVSTSYHVFTNGSQNPHKRPRLNETTTHNQDAPRTILNYSSDGGGTDDTYSDSEGTERDFVDDPYSYYDYCDGKLRNPQNALPAFNWGRLSTDEDSSPEASPEPISWRNIPDFKDDSSDSEYQPPDWNLEDVWELENAEPSHNWEMNPLYLFKSLEELRDRDRALSDDGLSTDDSDKGYHDQAITQRSSDAFAESLGLLLKHPYRTRNLRCPIRFDEDESEYKKRVILEEREYRWKSLQMRLKTEAFPPLNIEDRLSALLGSDHAQFYFDDEEWRIFEMVGGVIVNDDI